MTNECPDCKGRVPNETTIAAMKEARANRTYRRHSLEEMLTWMVQHDMDEPTPGVIEEPGDEFLSATCKVVACPVVYSGEMIEGGYFRFRYRGDQYCVGFGWQDFDDIQGVPTYQYGQADYSGDKWAGSMEWEEAREIIKRHYVEWVAGGWQL